jgi:putative addiction module component (TIGR02574 family)
MKTLIDLEPEVMQLPESDRAMLAAQLLGSLPAVLADEDDGVAEALRRDADLERDPSKAMTLDELRRSLQR